MFEPIIGQTLRRGAVSAHHAARSKDSGILTRQSQIHDPIQNRLIDGNDLHDRLRRQHSERAKQTVTDDPNPCRRSAVADVLVAGLNVLGAELRVSRTLAKPASLVGEELGAVGFPEEVLSRELDDKVPHRMKGGRLTRPRHCMAPSAMEVE